MSLLEDVFLEDEAGEARELERIIEGDEYDERPLSPNSDDSDEKEDEAEEDKRHVDPKAPKAVRVVKHPRFVLNPARLTGPRGIQVLPDHFKDFKFKGKGHEKEDLDMILKKLEHWAYRLYPKFGFKDCLKKIETLGKKRQVMVHLMKIRSDQLISEETVVQKDSSDDEEPPPQEDEFDKLLQQQIELARSTPAPNSVKKPPYTPGFDRSNLMPKATSSPSISEEQRERMLRNRRLAEERRLAKFNNDTTNGTSDSSKPIEIDIEGVTEIAKEVRKENRSNETVSVDVHTGFENSVSETTQKIKKHNISNVIDSSDDEEMADNESNVHTDIEITEVLTEIPKKERKHNRSIVIDSSDDEVTVNKSGAVDVHTGNKDVTEKAKKVRKHKSNVIDSSDDEMTVNEPVEAHVHTGIENSNHVSKINGIKDVNNDLNHDTQINNIEDVNDDTLKSSRVTVSQETAVVNSEKDLDNISDFNVNNIEKVEQIVKNDSQTNSPDVITDVHVPDNVTIVDNEGNKNIKDTGVEKRTEKKICDKNNDNNVQNSDRVDNIMEVDFNEDF